MYIKELTSDKSQKSSTNNNIIINTQNKLLINACVFQSSKLIKLKSIHNISRESPKENPSCMSVGCLLTRNQSTRKLARDQPHTISKMTPRSKSCSLLPNEPILSQTELDYDVITGLENHGYLESNPRWSTSAEDHHMSTLLHNLNLLSERVHQAKSLVSLLATSSFSSDQQSDFKVDTTSMIRVNSLVQEIVSVSSSMMFTCQQMCLSLDSNLGNHGNYPNKVHIPSISQHDIDQLMESSADIDRERKSHDVISKELLEHDRIARSNNNFGSSDDQTMSRWFDCGEEYMNVNLNYDTSNATTTNTDQSGHYEMIIEMNAADLLAKYTHFCQVCNKGFKRDANLRMHMRAHGDEYKSTSALANPKKNNLNNTMDESSMSSSSKLQMAKRYSCPQDGCRWNIKHPKFQPLKSMICVKNHYKRSHCPKMYVCKRCNQKEFSVVSDLRTHEKHCGYLKWRCSCGTTFSRKDKLVGHVRLFVGHVPVNQNDHI